MLLQLKENTLDLLFVKHFTLKSKENCFTKGFSINSLKERSVYKTSKDFSLISMADSHNCAYFGLGIPYYQCGHQITPYLQFLFHHDPFDFYIDFSRN